MHDVETHQPKGAYASLLTDTISFCQPPEMHLPASWQISYHSPLCILPPSSSRDLKKFPGFFPVIYFQIEMRTSHVVKVL